MDNWDVTRENTESQLSNRKVTYDHETDAVAVRVWERPNGTQLLFTKEAELPGGYKVLHKETVRSFEAATSEAQRWCSMYDREGTIFVEGAPILH